MNNSSTDLLKCASFSIKQAVKNRLSALAALAISALSCFVFSMPLYAAEDDGKIGFADAAVCEVPLIVLPIILQDAPGGDPAKQEISLEGDNLDLKGKNEITMSGKAQVVQGKRGVFADNIVYNKDTYQAEAKGNVVYFTPGGDEIKTDSMRLEIDTFIGSTGIAAMRIVDRETVAKSSSRNYLEDFTFFAPLSNRGDVDVAKAIESGSPVGMRAKADKIDIEGQDFQRLYNANITRCPQGEDVLIVAKEVELDHGAGVGYAKNVTVKFKGVPIMYAPRFSFPINDERKSGFLAPSIGDDDRSGLIFSIPYYFNLADNYDATIRTTYYTERGLQLFGEFRYLNEQGDGVLKAEYMPQDDVFNEDSRYAYSLKLNQNYSSGWGLRVDLQDVSDTQYLNDFRNDINLTSASFLPQNLRVNYSNDLFFVDGLASKYTAVSSNSASSPYDRLPQVAFGIREQKFGAFTAALDAEYINFGHDDANKLSGTRLNITPSISMPIEPVYGFLKPKLSYRSLSYALDNAGAGEDDKPSVSAPIVSVDSGLFFERETTFGGKPMLQTLEPRLMYVYVPEEDQSSLPLFDTGGGSVNSYNYLFREDRFFGGDRIGDDHHLAFGVSSRLINDDTGKERIKASIGQILYLDDREVGLNANNETQTHSTSDLFADLNAKITDEFSMTSFLRWDQEDKEVGNFNLGLEYKSGERRKASLDYSQAKNSGIDNDNLRLELDWPLAPRVQLSTDHRYSLDDSTFHASSLGVSYDGCCWAVGLSANRWLLNDGEYRETVLLTLELDGLGKVQTAR